MIKKTTSTIVIAALLGAACASASGSGAVARQTVRLEVIPVVEAEFVSHAEDLLPRDRDQTAADEMEFGEAPLAVYPQGYQAKITMASEHGTSVEVSVEASAGDSDFPRAAVRLTLTDP